LGREGWKGRGGMKGEEKASEERGRKGREERRGALYRIDGV